MDKISKNIADNCLAETVKHHLLSYISESEDARKAILAAYLFGSALHPEKFKKNSDVDLAFLLDRRLYKQDPVIPIIHLRLCFMKIFLIGDFCICPI